MPASTNLIFNAQIVGYQPQAGEKIINCFLSPLKFEFFPT
jgi:hypothetical protein